GKTLPSRLIGFFAFVLHDVKTGESLVARDPLGKKPFFYAEHGDDLLIASEARSFLVLDGFHRDLDPDALAEFLALRYVPGGRTILNGVLELPPGHLAVHRPGESLRPERYFECSWKVGDANDFEGAVTTLRDLFTTCVRDRLEADVPLGAFLSGGVDSSGVVYAMLKTSTGRVHAVNVGFDDGRHDESKFAREFADRHGVDLDIERCESKPEEQIAALTEILDLPLGDDSILPTWLVCRAARRHVTVAVSGDGGDEVFAGYRRYRFDFVENRARRWIGQTLPRVAAKVVPKGDWLPQPLRMKRTFENLARDPAEAYFRSVSALLPEEVHGLLAPGIAGAVDPFRELRRVYDASPAPDHASRLLDLDQKTYLPGDILTKVDRASMAVSLEVRSPLLDRRIVEWAARLPIGYKLDARSGKKVLKAALEPWLGMEWLQRKKQGFTTPMDSWLRGPLADVLHASIRGSFAQRFLDQKRLEAMAVEHQQGRRDHRHAFWNVIVLHQWNERWGKQA
ncbi:MAG: asparagine synthase (glutamine-hydrolyzing), partial [Planctomycetes bacterium]|nr:asparagine synthase (glutamine-hydrolyzing) [Planctomycetota bacterium]